VISVSGPLTLQLLTFLKAATCTAFEVTQLGAQ
jgi:hypothetical protein